jgi:hypothetical protein
MKTSKIGGHLRFLPEDHLTTAQVKSYFSRLTNSRRQQSQLSANVIPDNVKNNQRTNDSALGDDDVEEEEMDDDFELAVSQSEREQLRLEISNLLGPNSLWDA